MREIAHAARADPACVVRYVGMTGATIFAELMKEHDVQHIFGYPGGAILPVFDAIYDAETFDFILTRASAARQMVVCRR